MRGASKKEREGLKTGCVRDCGDAGWVTLDPAVSKRGKGEGREAVVARKLDASFKTEGAPASTQSHRQRPTNQ